MAVVVVPVGAKRGERREEERRGEKRRAKIWSEDAMEIVRFVN